MQLEYTLLHHGTALGSYCQSLPILVFCKENSNISCSCIIRKSLLYVYQTWLASSEITHHLTSADSGVVRCIFGVRFEQHIRTQELLEKLGIISDHEEIQ